MLHALAPIAGLLHIGLTLHFSCSDAANHDVDMDISRMVVPIDVYKRQFEYSVLRLSRSTVREGEEVQVTVTVKNTGAVAGKETVQLYVACLLYTSCGTSTTGAPASPAVPSRLS